MPQPPAVGSSVNRHNVEILTVNCLLPVKCTQTVTGTYVDLKNYEGCTVVFDIGTTADTLSTSIKFTPSIQECDTTNGTYTAITASGYVIEAGDMGDVISTATSGKIVQVALIGQRKRYVQGVLTFAGTHTNGTPCGIAVIKSFPRVKPAGSVA